MAKRFAPKPISRLKRFISGKTKLGQVIYGIVDVLPFPNVLNLVRAAIDAEPTAGAGRIASATLAKIDWLRMMVALLSAYLVLSGRVDTQSAGEFADMVLKILN